jgi:hypothetical protein
MYFYTFAAGEEVKTESQLTDRNLAQAVQHYKLHPNSQVNKAALPQKTMPQL